MFSARLGFMRPDSVTEPPIDGGGDQLDPTSGNFAGIARYTNSNIGDTFYMDTRKPIYQGNPPTLTGENSEFLNRAHDYWHILTFKFDYSSKGPGYFTIDGFNNLTTSQPYRLHPVMSMFGVGAYVDQTLTVTSNQRGSPMSIADICVIPHPSDVSVAQTELEKLEGYFADRYDLRDRLWSNHPYKSQSVGGFQPNQIPNIIWWNAQDNSRITQSLGKVDTWRDQSDTHTLSYRGDYKNNSSSSAIFDKFDIMPGDLNGMQTLDSECTLYRPEFTTDDRDTVGEAIGSETFSVVMVVKTRNHTTSANQAAMIWIRDYQGLANNYWQIKNIAGTSTYITLDSDSGNADVDVANVTTDGGNVSV